MPSRTARRARHKRLARLDAAPLDRKAREATRWLLLWRDEARHRARWLGAPAVWALAHDPEIRQLAQHLDPNGGLLSELERVCAEAIADIAGRHLVRPSRPLADRRRHDPT